MKQVVMTATEARKNFFDILNAAIYAGQTTVVSKNGVKVAEIKPKKIQNQGKSWSEYRTFLESIKGDMADYPEDENRKWMRKTLNKRMRKRAEGK